MALLDFGQPLLEQLVRTDPNFRALGSEYRSRGTVILHQQLQPYLVKYGVPNWQGTLAEQRELLRLFQRMEEHRRLTAKDLRILPQLADGLFHPILRDIVEYMYINRDTIYAIPAYATGPDAEEKNSKIAALIEQLISTYGTLLSLLVSRPNISAEVKQRVEEFIPSPFSYSVTATVADPILHKFNIGTLKTKDLEILRFVIDGPRVNKLTTVDMSYAELNNTNFEWPSQLINVSIDLSHNEFTDYPFSSTLGMRIYSLNLAYNFIQKIDEKWNKLSVGRLNLSYNRLSSFPTEILPSLTSHAYLILDGNSLTGPTTPLEVVTEGARMTSQAEPLLELYLEMRNCSLQSLPRSVQELIAGRSNIRLRNLYAPYNELTEFVFTDPRGLHKDCYINLDFNRLQRFALVNSIGAEMNLQLSHNRLQEIVINQDVDSLVISYNPLTQVILKDRTKFPRRFNAAHTLFE